MLNNPFRHTPEGLDPDDTEFLKRFGGLEVDTDKDIPAQAKEAEIPADEAFKLSITAGQREAYLNELVNIAPRFKIPRREHEAVVGIFRIINEDLPDRKNIVIENEVGNENSVNRIWVKENHVIRLNLSRTQIKSLDGVKLPGELLNLDLEYTPIQSLDGVKLPGGLQQLNLSFCNQLKSFNGVRLPERLQRLYLSGISIQYFDGITLPQGLQILGLSGTSIQSLDRIQLPEKMQVVYLYGTPLSRLQKMLELNAKYPNIKFLY